MCGDEELCHCVDERCHFCGTTRILEKKSRMFLPKSTQKMATECVRSHEKMSFGRTAGRGITNLLPKRFLSKKTTRPIGAVGHVFESGETKK